MAELITHIVLTALAGGYILSAVDRVVEIGFWRGILSLGLALLCLLSLGHSGPTLVVGSAAAAFSTLAILLRLDPPVTTVRSRP